MVRLKDWLVFRKDNFSLVIAILISLVLIFSNEKPQMETAKAWTLDGFGFILEKISVISKWNDLLEENQWLRRQNAELMLEKSMLAEAKFENQRLRKLLDFKSRSQLNLISAKVIGMEEEGFVNSIVLSVGKSDSVEANMAVVTSQGLVGKIFSAGSHRSICQLLLDRNFRVSGMVQRSRLTGIVKWQTGDKVVLSGVPKRSEIAVADTVVTSGMSSIFPGGLEIGRVIRISENSESMFMNIEIKPAVDFSKLEEVFVIKYQRGLAENL